MQGVPHGLDLEAVNRAMHAHHGVKGVHDLHVWALGSKEPILTAHLTLASPDVDAENVRRTIAQVLKEQFNIRHATLQIEEERCDLGAEHAHH